MGRSFWPLLYIVLSTQDIVILLDTSASMTGVRKDLAKEVVTTILDTLSEDDFVTILSFSDNTTTLVESWVDEYGMPVLNQVSTCQSLYYSTLLFTVGHSRKPAGAEV